MVKGIFINSGSNVLVLFLKLAVTFVMAPIIIRNLGNYDYGLWEILGAIVGYMGILDCGIRPAISRYAAKGKAEKSELDLQTIFSSAYLFLLLVGLILASVFISWGVFFPSSIAQVGESVTRYSWLLAIVGAQLMFVFPGYVAESYLEGFQKYAIKNNITIFNTIVGNTLLYIYITPENGLILLAGVNAVGMSVKYLVYLWLMSRDKYGKLYFRRKYFSKPKLRELLIFGSKSLVQGISTRIENATDSLVIGWFLGPAMVPFYSIPANLVQYIRTMGMTVTHVFMPVFSDLVASKQEDKVIATYLKGSKFTIAIIAILSIGSVFLGAEFIGIWMGVEYGEKSSEIILVLVAFVIVPFLNPFASRYLTAINEHAIFAKLTPISALINVIFSVVLVQYMGILGVAIGSLIPVFIFTPIYLSKVCRHLNISPVRYMRVSVLPVLLPSIAMVLTIIYAKEKVLIDSYFSLFSLAAISSVTFISVFYLTSLSGTERSFITTKIQRVWS